MKRVNLNSRLRSGRSGFTLLELLMVIAIIGILVSLLTAAVLAALGSARTTQVSAEITQLDQAIATFKSQFGIEPPSNLLIPAVGGAWDTKSRASVRAIWPQFDFATNGGMGNTGAIHLNGAECLVFFLGGMPNPTGTLSGFSKNPRTPWTFTAGNSDGPYFEFDDARLVDVDGDDAVAFPEYLDPLPDQQAPYLYLTGQGKHYNLTNNLLAKDDYDIYADPVGDPAVNPFTCYRKADWNTPQRADGFQIISPGIDGLYGPGGLYTSDSEVPERDLDGNSAIDPWELRDSEKDNITNFSNGPLAQ
jgi:prepilin-type N-terminal cleavage/methylation domain-containing protein